MNDEQSAAFDKIIEFCEGDETIFGLFGYAGTGKSFLTKHIAEWCAANNIKNCGVCPTHKAKDILEQFLNEEVFIPIPAVTVAKFLLKMRVHSYTGTKNFRGKDSDMAKIYDLFIVDECSMISDKDVEALIKNIKKSEKKVLFIGDPCQIPNPVQKYEWNDDGTISKKDSSSFDCPHVKLTSIVRQKEGSEIIEISKLFREDMLKEKEIPRENTKDLKFTSDPNTFYDYIEDNLTLENYKTTKVLAYTNARVRSYNEFCRDILGFEGKFVKGDILMGFTNIGFPVPYIKNGAEYEVVWTEEVTQDVDGFQCRGDLVVLEPFRTRNQVQLFFPHLTGTENVKMLRKLKKLAQDVNRIGSTKEDYKEYKRLKDQVMFLENIYEYDGEIICEDQFKKKHQKLFRGVSNYINPKSRKKYRVKDDFNETYGGIVDIRTKDSKDISENEKFSDQFMIIEMDLSYGYSITVHKSQGSTFEKVFVDEKDFEKLKDSWNSRYGAYVNSTKEKNQLKYVAYTRSSEKLFVLYKK